MPLAIDTFFDRAVLSRDRWDCLETDTVDKDREHKMTTVTFVIPRV